MFINFNNVFKDIIIKFGKVEFNDGNGYNFFIGKFIIYVDGIYLFLLIYYIKKGFFVYFCGFVNGKFWVYIGIYWSVIFW